MSDLDRKAIEAVDPEGMLADVLDMPNQLRDALWRVETAALRPIDARDGLIVAGMGGSAIGARLAAAALGDRVSRPLAAARDYALPAWATPEVVVLCASYSGNTEETLACFDAAGALGAVRIALTTGGALADAAREEDIPVIPLPAGLKPRAAVAYMMVSALEVAALCGVGPSVRSEVDVAAAHAERLVAEWGPDAENGNLAKALARDLHNTVPQVAGAGLTTAIAYRWKCQFNENSKIPAFSHELPELDHNEILGWEGAKDLARFSAIFLDDCDLHPRVRQRISLTRALVEPVAAATHVVQSLGTHPVERVVSLVLLGDLVSVYLAVLRGVDPSRMEAIERLKETLGKP